MVEPLPESSGDSSFDPSKIVRPDSSLLWYYILLALTTGPAFPFAFLPLLFKYETLEYRLDETGISMSWGLLWKREIHLTYRRIQDIHLTRNIVQRWMGLASVDIQTASGNAAPEMSIVGILEAAPLRDYLYTKMRGAKGGPEAESDMLGEGDDAADGSAEDEALELLREIRDIVRALNVGGGDCSGGQAGDGAVSGGQAIDKR